MGNWGLRGRVKEKEGKRGEREGSCVYALHLHLHTYHGRRSDDG